jgi:hypothetical protein
MSENKLFYAIGDIELIQSESIDEAVQYWYDGLCDIKEFQEEVEVDCFTPHVVSEKYWDRRLDDIVENLDENYGCEESCGDYSPSDKSIELWEAFTKQVISEYQVAQLKKVSTQKVSTQKVKVRDYVEVDHDLQN